MHTNRATEIDINKTLPHSCDVVVVNLLPSRAVELLGSVLGMTAA